jgi:hypothetical protein
MGMGCLRRPNEELLAECREARLERFQSLELTEVQQCLTWSFAGNADESIARRERNVLIKTDPPRILFAAEAFEHRDNNWRRGRHVRPERWRSAWEYITDQWRRSRWRSSCLSLGRGRA